MAFCSKCGAHIPDDSTFCNSCGSPVCDGYTYVETADGFDTADVNKNKIISAFSYLGILFFLPLVACPNSKFGRFHANQGLVLLITNIILNVFRAIANFVVSLIFTYITGFYVITGILTTLISIAVGGVSLALFLYGFINTLMGRAKKLPVIGQFTLIS